MTTVELPALTWEPTQNWSERALPYRGLVGPLVVTHRWAGGTFPGVVNYFKDPAPGGSKSRAVSSHIVYAGTKGRDANKCAQMVKYSKKAWAQVDFNSVSVSIEFADAIWLGKDAQGFLVAAKIVAQLLKVVGSPPQWVHGASLMHAPHGFTRHYDLGVIGGNHTDPTVDYQLWQKFVAEVQKQYKTGGLKKVWGKK